MVAVQGLEPGHRDYDSPALPAELHRPVIFDAGKILYPGLFVKKK